MGPSKSRMFSTYHYLWQILTISFVLKYETNFWDVDNLLRTVCSKNQKCIKLGLGCSLEVEHSPSMPEAQSEPRAARKSFTKLQPIQLVLEVSQCRLVKGQGCVVWRRG